MMAHPRNGGDKNQVLCVKIQCAALLLSVAVYLNGIFGDYVHDDLSVVVQNRDVQGATPLTQVFLNDFWGRRLDHPLSHKSYRPIVILSFRFERWLLGRSVASVSHVVNVLLHCVVVGLYTHVLLHVLLLPTAAVLLSAALFAVHPVHTEAVTGVVGRADLAAALSFLASFLAYHRATESRQRLADQRREEALQRSRSTSAFTGSGPLSQDFQRTQAGNYSASENYATARKPIKKNRKFKISDRPRKKGNGLCLYKGSQDAYDTKLVEHKTGFHFFLGLKYFSRTLLSILGYSCLKCFTNTRHSSPILKNMDERHRLKSIQPYQNSCLNLGKDVPFIAYTKRSLRAIFCRSSRTASRDVSLRRVPLWWCYSWAVLGVLCKEQAVTVLALCILWDALQTYGRSLRERVPASEIRLLLTRSTQTFVLGGSVVLLRVLLMGSPPLFSEQDNPASFNPNISTRFWTYFYLPAHNFWLLLCPSSLSCDWQLGSVPLIGQHTSDVRKLAPVALAVLFLLLIVRAFHRVGTHEGRAVLWSLAVMIFSFLPASNLFFPVGFVLAERLLYIPRSSITRARSIPSTHQRREISLPCLQKQFPRSPSFWNFWKNWLSLGYCTLVGIGASRLYSHQRAPQDKKNYQTFEQGKRKGEKMKSGRLCTSGDREKDLTTTKEDSQKNEQSCTCLNSPRELTTLQQCLKKQTPFCDQERSADRTLGACAGTLSEAIKKSFQRLSVSEGQKDVLLDSSGYSSAHSSCISSKNASPISSPYSSPSAIEGHPPFVCEELFAIDTKDSLEQCRPQQALLCRVSSPTSFVEKENCNADTSMTLLLKEFKRKRTFENYFENNCLNTGYQDYLDQYSNLRKRRHERVFLKQVKDSANFENLPSSEQMCIRKDDGDAHASCFTKEQTVQEMETAKFIPCGSNSSVKQKVILDRQPRLCGVNSLPQKHRKREKQLRSQQKDGGDRRKGKNEESNHRNVHINLSPSASNVNVPLGKAKVSKRLKKFSKYPTLGSLFPIGRSSSLTNKNNFTRALGQICLTVTFFFLVNKCLLRNFDWSSRETLLRSGLAVLPHNAKFHYNYGNLLREKEQYDLAVLHYLRAIQLWPEYPSARNNLAAVLVLQGRLTEAEQQLRHVVQQYPGHQNAALNLAKLYKRKQWFHAARRVVSNALRIAEVYRDPVISEQMLQLLQSLEQSSENSAYEPGGKSVPERKFQNTAEHGLANNDREVASLGSCELALEATSFQEKWPSCAEQTETITFKEKKQEYAENIFTPDDVQSFMKPEGVCCRYSRFRLSKFPSSAEWETWSPDSAAGLIPWEDGEF